jgi:hypothetical protein
MPEEISSQKNSQIMLSTGNLAFDALINGVIPGDNIVLQVDHIEDYLPFVQDFAAYALREKKDLIYFRFASHIELVPPNLNMIICELHPELGFETFIDEIFKIIEKYRYGACYIFDSLSELAVDWYSDIMTANFFMLTCPYLYDFETATFFAVIRNRHAESTLEDIRNTAQVVLDVYNHKGERYIHPQKVINRYSPTMYMLHRWTGTAYEPVRDSAIIAEILTQVQQQWLNFEVKIPDVWAQSFINAQAILDAIQAGKLEPNEAEPIKRHLLRMMIARDEKRLDLVDRYLDLEDLIRIGKRLIGTGLIGGKSVGMLTARAILEKTNHKIAEKLEVHDSFYVGSDVYYTFLVKNKIWWKRRAITRKETFLQGIEEAQELIRKGKFTQPIIRQFIHLLNYFGQTPIIVRSSSILEDNYGNAFSGKYESVFCVNQGNSAQRLQTLFDAIRKIYASTIDRDALEYRRSRNLLNMDEQMALLIQRVSGRSYTGDSGTYFFPQLAGVGFSYNPFVWSPKIDPKAGVLRIVFGLGTHAVDRIEDDYTRLVALNAPYLLPIHQTNRADRRKYSQHKMDVLNYASNHHEITLIDKIMLGIQEIPLMKFAEIDNEVVDFYERLGKQQYFAWIFTFDELIRQTSFIEDMSNILQTLQSAFSHPVDIEYTMNFITPTEYRINILQCRPFQAKATTASIPPMEHIEDGQIICKTIGPIIGASIATPIDILIYIEPQIYGTLLEQQRYAVARLVGTITNLEEFARKKILIMGPGRWGTTTPSLGVPVSFAEIKNVSYIAEIAEMHEGLIPDISLGTHFFNDLVELDMLYFAIHPEKTGYVLKREIIHQFPNFLESNPEKYREFLQIIKVVDVGKLRTLTQSEIIMHMDAIAQKGIIYFRKLPSTE